MAIALAIDGPTGGGKGTIARRSAERLGFHYLDTGLMYRVVALKQSQAPGADITEILRDLKLDDFVDSPEIRTKEIDALSAKMAQDPRVREFVDEKTVDVVRSGRDVVYDGRMNRQLLEDRLPNQFVVGIFLTASEEERGRRRFLQRSESDPSYTQEMGVAEVRERDKRDRERKHAPFCKHPRSVEIDSTHLNVDQTLEAVLAVFYGAFGAACLPIEEGIIEM